MSIHKKNTDTRTDEDFHKGHLHYLVEHNKCRLLDGRRTPGMIQKVDLLHAMFTFLILDYEDKGKTWDLYAEQVTNFQFEKDSALLSQSDIKTLEKQIKHFNEPLTILATKQAKKESLETIKNHQRKIQSHLKEQGLKKPYHHETKELQKALLEYFEKLSYKDIELEVSKQMVLNPNAGETAKQLAISLAKLGLKDYKGTILRKANVPQEELTNYLLHRLAFTQLLFDEMTLYRGMSSEGALRTIPRHFLSYTDTLEIAKAFCEFKDDRYKSVYLLKRVAQKEELFMTHYETKAFHDTYQEKEVVLIAYKQLKL